MTATVTVEGTGTERGETHGETLRDLIHEAAERWWSQAGLSPEVLLGTLIDRSGFRQAVRLHASDLYDEVEGIARASGVDSRKIWALNLLDEEWWTRQHLAGNEACSTFGVAPGGTQGALIAQNMDLPQWLHGLQALLDVRPPEGPRVLAPTYAGMVATNALNEHGIGVCVNTISELPTDDGGLPVAFMIRLIASQPDFESAVAVLRDRPHASGQNYLIGSPFGIADFECGAGTITACPAEDGRVAHTNHRLGSASGYGAIPALANSTRRLQVLNDRLSSTSSAIGPEEAVTILGDPPLRRGLDGDSGFTFYSVVMELGAVPALQLTAGPPGVNPYRRYSF